MDNDQGSHPNSMPDQPGAPQSHPVFSPGENFGNYRVVRCISAGLLINYYHMQHVRDLDDVTVGVLHPRTNQDAKLLKRLQGLQEQLNGIDHEGIPKIRDCSKLSGVHCIFFDPVEGETLSSHFVEKREEGADGLRPQQVSHISASLLGLLGCAHMQGLDHRDIDTDFVFVQEDGSVKVLGLGLRAALGDTLFESVVSASISPLHARKRVERLTSFDVLSPEHKSGIEEDSRVDVFAVGVIGYWLMTGREPNLIDLGLPSTILPGVSSSWDVFFAKSLERNKEDRYQSCKGALIGLKATEVETSPDETSFVQRQIDRIPVPKGVVDRGDLATRVYRLSLIGLIGVTLTALMASFFERAFLGESSDVPALVQAASGEPANVQLKLSPESARVSAVGHEPIFRAKNGKLNLQLEDGDAQLKILATGYVSQTIGIRVGGGRPDIQQEIVLQPKSSAFSVFSAPSAEVVLVDGEGVEQVLGETNADGFLMLPDFSFEGSYDVIVRKFEYSTFKLEDYEFSKGEETEIRAPLKALFTSLTIESAPEEARVYVNNVEIGTTPLTISSVEIGRSYQVVLRKQGFRTVAEDVQIREDGQAVLDFGQLARRSGSVDVSVEFAGVEESEVPLLLADLEIELDGIRMPFAEEELQSLDEGEYLLRAWHPFYRAEPLRFSVRDREVSVRTLRMEPLPGRLIIQLPEGLDAQVSLNGAVVALENGALTIPANTAATVGLEVRNYLSMRRQYRLGPNEQREWAVELVPIPGPDLEKDWSVPYLSMPYKWIPAGSFVQGSPLSERGRMPNEGPRTQVTFSQGYWVATFETTQAQYKAITGRVPSDFRGPRLPVESITWEQARGFCELLTERERSFGRLPEGYVYRLPTEAEWELAARGGSEDAYSFGPAISGRVGNFRKGLALSLGDREQYGALPVGSFEPNAFGLYDVHGNVAEWTVDRYDGRLPGDAVVDPSPHQSGERIAVRGGSWRDNDLRVRISVRNDVRPDKFSNDLGFRVVLAPSY